MTAFARAPLAAILGPTNTGKTHLAVERMCGHSSGMIGFPLRLRVVYISLADPDGFITALNGAIGAGSSGLPW